MEIPMGEDRYRMKRDSPSFSSSLLDQIYRSIDESNSVRSQLDVEEIVALKKMKKQQQQRDFLDLDERSSVVVVHRRSIAADFERSTALRAFDSVLLKHSSSSSSDSSGLSSSEADSLYGRSVRSLSPAEIDDFMNLKKIRTSDVERLEKSPPANRSGAQNPSRRDLGSFLKTKSKASKMYSDLKKSKQPISPGGRLASFINSILNAKKVKRTNKRNCRSEEAPPSTCSSASSFSRSCLSKTPNATGKLSDAAGKRSVRFCPVSIIVDQDLKPSGHKILHGYEGAFPSVKRHLQEDLEHRVMEENRRVVEAARELLRDYNSKNVEEDDDDDDVASCASSDLFELDNISAIGIDKYQEELPVYETTRLGTNRAIAHAFGSV